MHHPMFAIPDLTTLCRLDELGLQAVGQLLEPDRAVLECRVVDVDPWCRKCGAEGVVRDTVTRPLAHEPFGHRPTTLLVRVRRYRCAHCRRTWRQDTSEVPTALGFRNLTNYVARSLIEAGSFRPHLHP
ncbi:zinc-finger of transposase IS204/IS1001/IS1096/IS1165 [Micrococcales bacterium KH10]|nr:zinc-finger of transposase IS204/IS1001/IS1096/IS1165 [Micrococcales bacterium KH10]